LVQPSLPGIDEYRLASGDVVEISVIGAPDLGHRTASMHVRLQMLWDDLTGI
jgi:protein involved in polysaccharide export with SLBB domain